MGKAFPIPPPSFGDIIVGDLLSLETHGGLFMEKYQNETSVKLNPLVVNDKEAYFNSHGLICQFNGIWLVIT